MDRRARAQELRRLAGGHPSAPAEFFFSQEEIACLAGQARRIRSRRKPDTILGPTILAGTLAGRIDRNQQGLPAAGTLERAFEKLEILVEGFNLAVENS